MVNDTRSNAAPSAPPADAAQQVRALATDLGFALCGIAPAGASDYSAFVQQWLAEGKHGEMHYLAERLPLRLDPRVLLDGARSIIAVADFYPGEAGAPPADAEADADAAPRGRIARYAWGDDYHKVIKKRLHRLADTLAERHPRAAFRCTVDTAPLLEREHAARAGLGWTGKHTLLIHPRFGSYMLLGAIVTTLDLPASADDHSPGFTVPPADHCGTCTRCIDACPTQCIANPADHHGHRTLDATRCISYLTLEHRSLIDRTLHEALGDWLAGCDVCQDVCPYNQRVTTVTSPTPRAEEQPDEAPDPSPQTEIYNPNSDLSLPIHPRYMPRPELAAGLDLLDVLHWTADDRQRVFQGSALKRMKLEMVKRNALIAAGNALATQDLPRLRQRVEQLAHDADEHPLVRDTARQVLERVRATRPGEAVAQKTGPADESRP